MERTSPRKYDGHYTGGQLARISFPLGGMGAGMVCLEGSGAIGSVSVRHRPEIFHEPMIFATLAVKTQSTGNEVRARIIEGPVPSWKVLFPWGKGFDGAGAGGGTGGKTYGLPHFSNASFRGRFPFASVSLDDPAFPLAVTLVGWSPFIPGDADNSSLPVAALEYTIGNAGPEAIEGIYSFHSKNFLDVPFVPLPNESRPACGVRRGEQGFVLFQEGTTERPWLNGSFAISTDAPGARINCRWMRGGWFDSGTVVWKTITELTMPESDIYTDGTPSSPGGSIYVPIKLAPGESTTICIRFAWYVPQSNIRQGRSAEEAAIAKAAEERGEACPSFSTEGYRPWYASRFESVDAVDACFRKNYAFLRGESEVFRDCLFDSTMPPEVVDAVSANLSIFKSPTMLRQADGRMWLWEGCLDEEGSCYGSCTHVWNYAHAMAHLFPSCERTLRDTEFFENQDDRGHQAFRTTLPIRKNSHDWYAAADGQLGGIIKTYRDWRIIADFDWLKTLWPKIKASLDFCIAHWDPDREGWLKEPHHNTYDIEFWGPDGMCGSFYVAALRAAVLMGEAVGDPAITTYDDLYRKARSKLENDLYDGEYFIQKIRWKDLHAPMPDQTTAWNVSYCSEEARVLLAKEGPKYQYGNGCLSDGIIGAWMAETCGLGDDLIDEKKVASHLKAIHKYNFRPSLADHACTQRPSYAIGNEAGLLLCSWPKGGRPTLPFVYSDEIWTGIEYQVAAHLMMSGQVAEGLEIVRAARDRYDGTIRNPYSEIECGHWYGRALASYSLLQGLTGQRYDAVTQTLHLKPRIPGDWRSFISTATGYGVIAFRNGQATIDVKRGTIDIKRVLFEA